MAIFGALLSSPGKLYAQNLEIDSLAAKSYRELRTYFNKTYVDTINDLIYAKAYLLKARKDKDSIKMANAYYYLSDASPNNKALLYCDSMVFITKSLKTHTTYAALGYLQKGNIFYAAGHYKEALDQYVICLDFSEKSGNDIYALTAIHNIGLLKNQLGERKEALLIFKRYVNHVENSKIDDKDYYLIRGLYALSDSYVYNRKNDSAAITIAKGLNKAIKARDALMQAHYVYISGVNHYFQENYKPAIDSLSKSKKVFDDITLHATADLYLGKSYHAIDEHEKSIFYFKKVDSFLQKTNNVTIELIETYQYLTDYYKGKEDREEQLHYINKFIKFDSVLDTNRQYLSKNIAKKYEVRELLLSKEKLINELSKDKTISRRNILFLLLLSLVLLLVAIYFLRRNLIYKKRFNAVFVEQHQKNNLTKKTHKGNADEIVSPIPDIGLPEEMIKAVLHKLEKFEKSKKFAKKNYTLSSLAKELHTNSSYLSKIINTTKSVNFSNYLNDLRIEYAIEKLTEDKLFRAYTIEAIANAVGFNKAQSFSTAFYKKTGIYPSYFIKQLKKQDAG